MKYRVTKWHMNKGQQKDKEQMSNIQQTIDTRESKQVKEQTHTKMNDGINEPGNRQNC